MESFEKDSEMMQGYHDKCSRHMSMRDKEAFKPQLDGSTVMDNFTTPRQMSFDTPEMQGSMQQMLADNIGEYVVAEFLIGTERLMRKQGILYSVGRSFVVLYDDLVQNFIVCDIFSIKFVYFYLPNQRPRFNYNVLPANNGNGMNNR